MADITRQLRIFIASPGDCDAEREQVRRIAKQDPSIEALCRRLSLSVDVFGYENLPPDAGRPQSLINSAIETFNPDWFVFILWHRFGSDAGLGLTGTEEEWELARRMSQEGDGWPLVSLYFNQATPHNYQVDEGQLASLRRFRDKVFDEHQALACSFTGTSDFEEKFRAHLTERLLALSEEDREPLRAGLDRLRKELAAASKGLLSWPRTLGQDQTIDRPELQLLLARILETQSSTTLILGGQGSGKSALLATLGLELSARGITALAIKADMLGRSVNRPEMLREWLQLAVAPGDALRILAKHERVVLLVDQLDALSELLDRHSERLNVLLNLIQALSSAPNMHIVASCREFEFRHDVRLSCLKADRMELALPSWDQIAPILEQAGHNPTSMGQTLRDLLSTPWHLKIFLDIASPGDTFQSLHALLGALWDKRVLDADGAGHRLALLEKLASAMSDEETLWLPVAMTDHFVKGRQMLEQAEILARGSSGQTIGFRHQSYYDYSLARAFARGSVSLAQHVVQRQDGLFVRPVLLNGLNYLRATAPGQYHRELQTLITSRPRQHIHTLLIEFLGGQRDPDDMEASLVLPLLDFEEEAPRILLAVAGSPGWFARLRLNPRFERWMRRRPEQAIHCLAPLKGAIRFDREGVLALLEHNWLVDPNYDALTLTVLVDLDLWDSRAIALATQIIRRTESWTASLLAERVAESSPELAPALLRADLDRRLEQVLQETPQQAPPPPTEADEQERVMHELLQRPLAPLQKLIEDDHGWHEMEALAEAAPTAFLESIWPWFVSIVTKIANDEHEVVVGYRDDSVTLRSFDGELEAAAIVRSLLSAVSGLANSNPERMLKFVEENASSDLLIVHRLLARGLERITPRAPDSASEYLLGDPRRLILGDWEDSLRETKRLIASLCPHLSSENRKRLEHAVVTFNRYREVQPEWTPSDRFDRLKWTRQDRLRLLGAFPDECLTAGIRRLKEQEERAFPHMRDHEARSVGGWVGPRITAAEMRLASDHDLLRLFDELPDGTEWNHPRRQWSEDFSRAGGAVQLSREFRELAKGSPDRVAALLSRLQQGRHETYAGAGLEGLAESPFPPDTLMNLIGELEQRGFISGGFREDVASALEKVAGKVKGLPAAVLNRLERWLTEHPDPAWPSDRSEERRPEQDRGGSILFGYGGIFAAPHGRGAILRAIAAGYLAKEPPDLENWARVIQSQLERERHPAIWVQTLSRMPVLFNGDAVRATRLFDAVIRVCSEVLRHKFALYAIARVMRWFDPRERVHGWLNTLLQEGSPFCRQAYGELLMLYHCQHEDAWAAETIRGLLDNPTDPTILCGLAYGASHLWHWSSCQATATDILYVLAAHTDDPVRSAVAQIFALNRDNLRLSESMRRLINRVATCPPVLLKAAEDLVEALAPFASTEPDLLAAVCEALLGAVVHQTEHAARPMAFLAESMTDIALTLHRQTTHRERGLRLFEQMLAMNLRETRAALDLLDRRPIQATSPPVRRRRRRRR